MILSAEVNINNVFGEVRCVEVCAQGSKDI